MPEDIRSIKTDFFDWHKPAKLPFCFIPVQHHFKIPFFPISRRIHSFFVLQIAMISGFTDTLSPIVLSIRWSGSRDAGYLEKGSFILLFTLRHAPRTEAKPLGAGIVMELAPDRFLLVGTCCTLRFMTKPGVKKTADILRLTEGTIEKGAWKQGRIPLNLYPSSICCLRTSSAKNPPWRISSS